MDTPNESEKLVVMSIEPDEGGYDTNAHVCPEGMRRWRVSEGPESGTDMSGQADGLRSQTDASDVQNSAETAVAGHAGVTRMHRAGPTWTSQALKRVRI